MSETTEFSQALASSPTLEKLVPNFDDPYIKLNAGHTHLVLGDETLATILEGYREIEKSPEKLEFMQIPTRDFPKLFDGVSQETRVAFQNILKQEVYRGKMSALIKAYKTRIDLWGQPDITQEKVAKIRKEALEALRQQHAVSNLPSNILPYGFTPYEIGELEIAAVSIDEADKLAETKGIVFAST